jgi:hypothetical protein
MLSDTLHHDMWSGCVNVVLEFLLVSENQFRTLIIVISLFSGEIESIERGNGSNSCSAE